MRHTIKHPYQAALWALTLFLSMLGLSIPVQAASKSKPIEILSDPFGYGVPTHYTVLRGHTKATFSHPMFGQFTRAEIVQREKDGYRTTRFALSPDGKTYQPVMIQFRAFETYGYPKEDEHCVDPSLAMSPLSTVKALGPAVQDGEVIAKRRDELAKARFFDASCFDPSVPEAHRNAIFNAAADVLTPDLQEKNEFPKYLRCLEKNGLADESGVIQGKIQQALKDTGMAPKLKLSCTADKKAKPGQYNEKTRAMSLRLTPKPDRERYAQKVFHELLHTVPIHDGLPLDLIEECCTTGEQCSELQAAAEKRKAQEKVQAVLATSSTAAQSADATKYLLAGSEIGNSFATSEVTPPCTAIGRDTCRKSEYQATALLANLASCTRNIAKQAVLFMSIIPTVHASEQCPDGDKITTNPDLLQAIGRAQEKEGRATLAEVAKTTPVTSPISWDAPVEAQQPVVPLGRLASQPKTGGGRTIASIAPLPEPATAKSLGSSRGRRDVAQSNRATVLVDTLERAASSVTKQLTFEKLDARKVEPSEVFRSASADKDKSMFVVASLTDRPFQISNVADVKGLTFPNPFAKSESMTLAKVVDPKMPATPSEGNGSSETHASTSSEDHSATVAASAAAGLAGSRAVQTAGLHAAIGQTARSKGPDRSPNKTAPPDFENMSHGDLRKFLVGSYRQVAEHLEDQKFARALLKNGIQIYDHENRQIGATKPAMVEGQMRHTIFIYNAEKSRLIQSRASSRDQTR
jgi:hypothetical protein